MKKKELAGLESRWKTVEREVNDGKKRSDKMEADLLAMRNKLGSSGWDEEKEKKEEETKRDLRNQLQRLHEVRVSLDFLSRLGLTWPLKSETRARDSPRT